MGKTTLCNTIMGLVRATSGEIELQRRTNRATTPGEDRQKRHLLRAAGPPPVPVAHRRRAPVDAGQGHARQAMDECEPCTTCSRASRERRRNGGAELSGGEQQMLAVGRALLLNGSLVVMDEPSEGLAPTIVDTLIDVVHRLVAEGVAVLVVEQNLRAATRMADRQLVMVSGRIQAETTAAELIASPELQQRYLGVEGAATASIRPETVMTSTHQCRASSVRSSWVARIPTPGSTSGSSSTSIRSRRCTRWSPATRPSSREFAERWGWQHHTTDWRCGGHLRRDRARRHRHAQQRPRRTGDRRPRGRQARRL